MIPRLTDDIMRLMYIGMLRVPMYVTNRLGIHVFRYVTVPVDDGPQKDPRYPNQMILKAELMYLY